MFFDKKPVYKTRTSKVEISRNTEEGSLLKSKKVMYKKP